MPNEKNKISNIRPYRISLVNLLYRFYLMNYDTEEMKQDLLDLDMSDEKKDNEKFDVNDFEKTAFKIIDDNQEILEEIENNLKDGWRLDRLPPLIKAVLVEGIWEIQNTNINKAITINELVNYVKFVEPDYDYKFVNGILDKFKKK